MHGWQLARMHFGFIRGAHVLAMTLQQGDQFKLEFRTDERFIEQGIF